MYCTVLFSIMSRCNKGQVLLRIPSKYVCTTSTWQLGIRVLCNGPVIVVDAITHSVYTANTSARRNVRARRLHTATDTQRSVASFQRQRLATSAEWCPRWPAADSPIVSTHTSLKRALRRTRSRTASLTSSASASDHWRWFARESTSVDSLASASCGLKTLVEISN